MVYVKNKVFSLALAVTIAVMTASAPLTAHAADYTPMAALGGEVTSIEQLYAALGGEESGWLEDGVITLTRDVELASPISLARGEYTVLGAGVEVRRAFEHGAFFVVTDGASLVLGSPRDRGESSLVLAGDTGTEGSLLCVLDGGLCTVNGGVKLTQGSAERGGGVYIDGGSLLLAGGTVEGCTASCGGGIYLSSGDLGISSGMVIGCSAERGGGIYAEDSSVMMSGGCVGEHVSENDSGGTDRYGAPNTASEHGGGLFIASGDATLTGGEISGCTAAERGGCAYISDGASSALAGVLMRGGEARLGGCVYSAASVIHSGAVLVFGTAEKGGCLYTEGKYIMSEGAVRNGTASELGGGIYNAGDFSFEGGSVINCTAKYGGAVYNGGDFEFIGGVLGHSDADIGDAFLNMGALSIREKAYVYDDGAIALTVCGGDESGYITVSGELTGAEKIALVELVIADGKGFSAARPSL